MDVGKERESSLRRTPEGIIEHIDDISEEVEAVEGVKRTVSTYSKQVTDDAGNNLTQSSDNQSVTVVIPQDDATLAANSKGDTTSALTWLAVFWKRLKKKALHFGWRIIKGKGKENDGVNS